jgi:hypothetical protein
MSGYGDDYKDQQRADFISRWIVDGKLPALTPESLAWNVARARAAEHELQELKNVLRVLREAGR